MNPIRHKNHKYPRRLLACIHLLLKTLVVDVLLQFSPNNHGAF